MFFSLNNNAKSSTKYKEFLFRWLRLIIIHTLRLSCYSVLCDREKNPREIVKKLSSAKLRTITVRENSST